MPELDLGCVEQIVEHSQVRAIAEAIVHLGGGRLGGGGGVAPPPIDEVLRELAASLESDGLDTLKPGWRMGNLAMPRALEVGAALSRLRGLSVPKVEPPRAT
jgi:hypothetical protein